ncbi:hypothetical protein [Tahibacter sp.]|uniref:hypothetical protein n=1 Tax=Tahibacter sp. TaxID=2056211 RepID=UPI0028C42FB5|nr:hypothetical protein [Tahibacter sp.]
MHIHLHIQTAIGHALQPPRVQRLHLRKRLGFASNPSTFATSNFFANLLLAAACIAFQRNVRKLRKETPATHGHRYLRSSYTYLKIRAVSGDINHC